MITNETLVQGFEAYSKKWSGDVYCSDDVLCFIDFCYSEYLQNTGQEEDEEAYELLGEIIQNAYDHFQRDMTDEDDDEPYLINKDTLDTFKIYFNYYREKLEKRL